MHPPSRSRIILSKVASSRLPSSLLKKSCCVATAPHCTSFASSSTTTVINPVNSLIRELGNGSRAALAKAITLVESRNATKRKQGDIVLKAMMKAAKHKCEKQGAEKSMIFRIGISGAPGVGKSTFLETFGMKMADDLDKKLAILCIDPSANTTAGHYNAAGPAKQFGGSILGDLARMTNLSRHPNAFIRQSPTSGALGGVARGTHESVVLCEGAGYDLVFIETVGVGQSEVSVCDMVDMFVLLLSPAHGDELQGVKRGIMEMCDLIIVTKADGQLASKAKITQSEFMSALKYLQPRSQNWKPPVLRCSAITGEGLDEIWATMQKYWHMMAQTGELRQKRDQQLSAWLWRHVQDELMFNFAKHPQVAEQTSIITDLIRQGELTPGAAAEQLLNLFFKDK